MRPLNDEILFIVRKKTSTSMAIGPKSDVDWDVMCM